MMLCLATGAAEIWSSSDDQVGVSLSCTLKSTTLASDNPEDPFLYPADWTMAELLRARLGLSVRFSGWANLEVAYEQRGRYDSDPGGAGTGLFLADGGEAPFRIAQLDREIGRSGARVSFRHELDRASLAIHPRWGEVTIGRQAIGLGRGVLFSAVDVFNPFSPLEVDREWRRGVDALRVEYRFSGTGSVEVIGVAGDSWSESALLGRIRGYVGRVDGEVIFGRRAEDTMVGVVLSGAVADAEVHGEFAVFETPEAFPDSALFDDDHLVAKAVLGTSYTFDVGDGLTVLAEYHYSGFGVREPEATLWRFLDPAFVDRYLRGEFQLLGQHAAALQVSYPLTDACTGNLSVLSSPKDGSGVVIPSLNWDAADYARVLVSVYVPWGQAPSDGVIESEYGGTPLSAFLQLSLYF